jgi:hypothetical protein
MLDDGALRFVKPGGVAVDSVLPGFTQPLGDWSQLPPGAQANKWAGERMDYGLGIEVLLQQARRAKTFQRERQAEGTERLLADSPKARRVGVRQVNVTDEQAVAVDKAMVRNTGDTFAGAGQPFDVIVDGPGAALVDGG